MKVSKRVIREAATQARKDCILPYVPACNNKEYKHNYEVMERLCQKVIEAYLEEINEQQDKN